MQVAEPLGHADRVRGLWNAAAQGRLPHALLFEGVRGTGRFLAARWLAQGLLCAQGPGDPCGVCGPCKRVLSGGARGNHPDLYLIDPVEEQEETIKLARIAERDGGGDCAEVFLRLRPAEGGWRVLIVREADRMQAAAQNALLKTLEEPEPGTLIVLESARPDRLLDTIRSRCVPIVFEPLSPEDTRAVLERSDAGEADRDAVARWSGGSPGEALRLAAEGAPAARALVLDVLRGARHPLVAARALWELDGEFAGGTARAQARGRARSFLGLALELLADAQRAAAGVAFEDLRHGDLGPELLALGGASAPGGVLETRLEALLEGTREIEANLAPEVVVERCLLALAPAGRQAAQAGRSKS